MTIGERIKELRQIKGYSLTTLAKLAGVSKSYLSSIERDLQTNPSRHYLSKLAIPLGTTVGYLLGEETENDLDADWIHMVKKAIEDGMSKDDFLEFLDFVKFQKWKKQKDNYN
ncbi:XRE family transcriptional regulator of biofilm formation [Bacillus oleivorans]|uniref:XRE family transcriptional regulator of biofilm formation n=1 Tax=Bacillus oleivorans TaxID=1448271 RepID=A0A285CS23_9BACI|nr:helix-turn-helix domain-containing protein [Bacillus oleivorans]SNX70351.1 XRE family transcriptional regulator of biofilm formation [Bacillus oleivorans]